MGKLTISMAMFNSYVSLPEGNMVEKTGQPLVASNVDPDLVPKGTRFTATSRPSVASRKDATTPQESWQAQWICPAKAWLLGGISLDMIDGSIPLDTIFSGMNIHKSQLFWGSLGTRVLTHTHMIDGSIVESTNIRNCRAHLSIPCFEGYGFCHQEPSHSCHCPAASETDTWHGIY